MYIDDLTFLEPLETGAYSIVWKVKYRNNKYALKMISKDKYKTKIQKKNLKREIKIHKQLNHENIICFHNHFEDDFFLYILLELGDEDLFNFHNRREHLTETEILNISYQIIKGLKYLKERNIIHSDIKLENILTTSRGQIKICDFGLSTQDSYHFSYVGTPEFMAPEIIKRQVYNHKVDVWSFGIILFVLVYNYSPFTITHTNSSSINEEETQFSICHDELKFPQQEHSIFNELIKKCLEKDPTKRATIEELYQDEIFSEFKI
jgi:serine/threonine protein kinase